MKKENIMKAKRIITITGLIVAMAVVATFGIFKQTQPVKAQASPPEPERISFGLVGITSGQTIRVSVANTVMPNDVGFPPGPSRVVITVRGMNGQFIRNRNGDVIRRSVDVERGDTTFIDIDYDQLPPGPTRAQLRPVIVVWPPGPTDEEQPPPIGESIAATVDVINNANGRSAFVMFTSPAVARGFNPQPDPPLGQ